MANTELSEQQKKLSDEITSLQSRLCLIYLHDVDFSNCVEYLDV